MVRRLDQILSARGYGSRKEVFALVRAGLVYVNGVSAHNAGQKINLDQDCVTVRGTAVDLQAYRYIMLHKPAGVVSAARDASAATVLDLLSAQQRHGLFPVGRLDKDTTGLLLLTNDGALGHALTSPRRHVPKTYLAALRAPASQEDVAAFAQGIRLPSAEGRPPELCLPAELIPLENNLARVVLHEGKYHQIKRMFAARGNAVLSLHREAMGSLALDSALAHGEFRALTAAEISELRER